MATSGLSAPHYMFTGRVGVFDRTNLRRLDPLLVLLTLVLAFVGIVNMYSVTHGAATPETLESAGFLDTIRHALTGRVGDQLFYLGLGLLVAAFVIALDYRFAVSMAPLLFVAALALLVLVLVIGIEVNGARRWIDLKVYRLQPSELAKVALVYMLAWYLSRIGPRIRKLPYFALAFVFAALPVALIARQPSLSSAITFLPVVFVMLFAAGCRLWHVAALVLPVALAGAAAFAQVNDYRTLGPEAYAAKEYPFGLQLKGYQARRVLTFLDPESDRKGAGFQSIQMRITVGSGEMLGKGFGGGTQTHFKYLPEFHTDLIFALVAEEWGFVGSTTVIVLFLLFFMRSLGLAQSCPDTAGSLLAIGCTTILAFHAFTNIAITLCLLPVTGVPLPFLSYGGSFYLTTMLCVGTLLSVHARKPFFRKQVD
jgi:rod shape determining protein RodA